MTMPEPIVRSGLSSNQKDQARSAAGVVFPPVEPRAPGAGPDDLIFESWSDFYRLQINSPEVAVNLATGTKTKAKNEFVQFTNGSFIPKGLNKERDVKAIMESKAFGAPFKANIWLRSERQKLEVGKAISALTDQLKARPDLLSMVSKRLKELAGAGKTFTLPAAPDSGTKELLEPEEGAASAAL
jgi:hypothetical protein